MESGLAVIAEDWEQGSGLNCIRVVVLAVRTDGSWWSGLETNHIFFVLRGCSLAVGSEQITTLYIPVQPILRGHTPVDLSVENLCKSIYGFLPARGLVVFWLSPTDQWLS